MTTTTNAEVVVLSPNRLGSRVSRWLPVWVAEYAEGGAWVAFVETVHQHHAEKSPASLTRATVAHGRWSAIYMALGW